MGPLRPRTDATSPAPTSPTRPMWRNGHEWAKRKATKAGISFADLANSFAACADPLALQRICDGFGPEDISR